MDTKDVYEDRQILQIMPSGGWRAVFTQPDGTPETVPLAAWAVVRVGWRERSYPHAWLEGRDRYIVEGFTAGPRGGLRSVESQEHWTGYSVDDGL